MVDPVSIGALVAALVASAQSKAADGAVDSAVNVAQKAVEMLRRRFSGDAEAEGAIDGVVDAPDSGDRVKALADLLEARAQESPELHNELQAIVGEAERSGVQIRPIEQTAEGENIVQLGGIVDSQVEVRMPPAPD